MYSHIYASYSPVNSNLPNSYSSRWLLVVDGLVFKGHVTYMDQMCLTSSSLLCTWMYVHACKTDVMDKLALCSFYLVFSWKIQGSEWPQNTQSGPWVRDRWVEWDNRALTAQQAWQLCLAPWAFHTFLRELWWIPFLTHSYACCPCNASKNASYF